MNKQIKKTLIFAFLMMLVLNLAHPVTPSFIKERFNDFSMFGYMLSAMSLGSFIAAKHIGRAWDKYHSKYVLLVPFVLIYPVGQYLLATAPTKTIILFARFLSGIGGAAVFFVVLPAMIAELSTAFTRSQNQLYFTINFGLAAQVGYLLGGYLGDIYGPTNTIIIQAVASALLIIPGYFLISNGIKHKHNFAKENLLQEVPDPVFDPKCKCNIFKTHKLYRFLILVTPMFLIFSPLSKFYDITLAANGFTSTTIGVMAMVNGLVALLFSLFIGRKIIKKYDELNPLTISVALMMASLILIGFTKNIQVLILIMPIWWSLQTLSRSLIVGVVAKRFRTQPGEALGIRKRFHDFGNVAGALLLGWIFNYFQWGIYLFAGIILVPTTIFLVKYRKHLIEHLGGKHWW